MNLKGKHVCFQIYSELEIKNNFKFFILQLKYTPCMIIQIIQQLIIHGFSLIFIPTQGRSKVLRVETLC